MQNYAIIAKLQITEKYSSAHGQIKNSGDMRDIIGFFRTFVSFM